MRKAENVLGIKLDEARRLIGKLTPRQRQVAEEMAMGKPNKTIAEELKISRKTLDIHRAMICSKLETTAQGVPRIVFAARFAEE